MMAAVHDNSGCDAGRRNPFMVGGTVNLNETCVGVLTGTSSVDQMKLDGGNNNVTTADGMMGNCTS
jgi:hypothetical protein